MPDISDQPFRGHLHHLELGSPDPARLADWYAKSLDMRMEAKGASIILRGPERVLIISPGEAKTLISAGYALADPATLAGLRARLSKAGVAEEPLPTGLFCEGVAFRDPGGNLIEMGLPATAPTDTSPLPGRLQHLVVASRNADAFVDFYTEVVGLRQSDRVLDDAGALRTCFMRTDDEHHSLAVFQSAEDRLDHHCYEAVEWNAIRDWGDHFASLREPVKWGPGRHGPGNNLFLFVHDADGNWVELSAELEIVGSDRPVGEWPHEERTLNSWGQAFLRS
jgi:catechol 2,3-dioxygenase